MKKILVVDDAPEIRHLVCATLENDEHEVLEARNASEALTVAFEHKPDLVIMDVRMPGSIDGIRATELLKQSADMSGCQVIMLSGMGGTREIRDAMNAGAVEYLKKPFSPLELIGMVEKVLHEPVNKV